jgi:hypothetical protein
MICADVTYAYALAALIPFEQGGIFIMPHLLWHGTSVLPVSSEGLSHLVAFFDTQGDVEDFSSPGPHGSLMNFYRYDKSTSETIYMYYNTDERPMWINFYGPTDYDEPRVITVDINWLLILSSWSHFSRSISVFSTGVLRLMTFCILAYSWSSNVHKIYPGIKIYWINCLWNARALKYLLLLLYMMCFL